MYDTVTPPRNGVCYSYARYKLCSIRLELRQVVYKYRYPRALTANEIADIMKGGKPLDELVSGSGPLQSRQTAEPEGHSRCFRYSRVFTGCVDIGQKGLRCDANIRTLSVSRSELDAITKLHAARCTLQKLQQFTPSNIDRSILQDHPSQAALQHTLRLCREALQTAPRCRPRSLHSSFEPNPQSAI